MGWSRSTHGAIRDAYEVLIGVRNIKIDFKETGWEGVDWTYLIRDRNEWLALVNTVMNPQVP
jgi:hypothetical protein